MNVDIAKRKEYLKENFYRDRKIIYGGFKGEMTWKYYLSGFEITLHGRLESIKELVILFMDDLKDEFKNTRFPEHNFFLFDDNFSISFTERSWGDFMAAVQNKGLTYKEFYGMEDL
jgi:hypothetical protein